MRVCVCTRASEAGGVMWCDMDHIRLVKQVLQLLHDNCSYHEQTWPWDL